MATAIDSRVIDALQRTQLGFYMPTKLTAKQPTEQPATQQSPSAAQIGSRPTLNDALAREAVMARLRHEIGQLALLQDNWDGYGAERPTDGAIRRAEDLLQYVWNVAARAFLVPAAEGGVAICFTREDRVGQIEFTNDGDTIGLVYSNDRKPLAFEVPADDIASGLIRIRDFFTNRASSTSERATAAQ